MISNLKTWLQGTHRGVSKEHLQVYLDEYVFRFNRRRTPMAAFQSLLGLGGSLRPERGGDVLRMAAFQSLLGLGGQQAPTTYRQIYAEGLGGRSPVLDPSIP